MKMHCIVTSAEFGWIFKSVFKFPASTESHIREGLKKEEIFYDICH